MARPTTKEQLITASCSNFEKLDGLIGSMSVEEQNRTFAFDDRDRNIRDVLVHLYEWHKMLCGWVRKNMAGDKADFLPKPYNWKTYPQMNIALWKSHQKTPLNDALAMFRASHREVMDIIGKFTDDELFVKKFFNWTGSTNLGSYCISATASHYDWAIKKIIKHLKTKVA